MSTHIPTSIQTLIDSTGGTHAVRTGNVVSWELTHDNLVSALMLLKKEQKLRLKTVAAFDDRAEHGVYRVRYVFAAPQEHLFLAPYISVDPKELTYPSLVESDQEFALYEREIFTFFGLRAQGNPNLNRVILHEENFPEDFYPLRKDVEWNARVSYKEPQWDKAPAFKKYEGEGVYEIPVGPVHAGIIEPGHFRFSMFGEEILMLQARLGYVHKGVEKLFETLPIEKKIKLSERISGDSSVSHALAFSQSIEELVGIHVPRRAQLLRVIYAELERLACHFNDIGFIMSDTGFSFGGAHGTRLREKVMQQAEKLTDSRYMRSVIVPGGVTKDIGNGVAEEMQHWVNDMEQDFNEVMTASMEMDSLLNRLKSTGKLDPEAGRDHGVIGVAARAIGDKIDARVDMPYAAYDAITFQVPTEATGDVYARFMVRVQEVSESLHITRQALDMLSKERSPIAVPAPKAYPKNGMGVGIVEGWRGDIVYLTQTDSNGEIARVKVRDTSFLNWRVYPYTVPADIVPDFPLINKSYNLSYTGNDL